MAARELLDHGPLLRQAALHVLVHRRQPGTQSVLHGPYGPIGTETEPRRTSQIPGTQVDVPPIHFPRFEFFSYLLAPVDGLPLIHNMAMNFIVWDVLENGWWTLTP